jgi:hypothetical protein
MAPFFQLWIDETNTIIDEFDTEQAAAEEVSRLYLAGGECAMHRLSLLRLNSPDTPKIVAMDDNLMAYVDRRASLRGD